MKRILPILFVLAFVQSYAQKTQQSLGTKHTMVVALSDFKVDSLLFLPERDTTFTPYKNGAVVLKQSDSSLYYYAQYWRPMGGAFVKTVYKRGDSLFYQRGGAEYFVAKWGLRAFTVPSGLTATQIGDSISVTSVLNGLVIGNGTGFATATVDTPLYFSGGRLRMVKSSNDSSGYLSYFDWRAFNAKVDPSREVNGVMSITGGGPLNQNRNLQLVNDQLAPPASHYYGTNTVGVKGWFALPEGGGTSPVTSVHGRIGDIVALQSDYSDYYSLLGHTHYGLAPLGGSAGQVLKKLSNNNYDYAWMDDLNDPGSSTGVFVDTIARVGNDLVWRKNFTDYTLENIWNQYKAGNGLKLSGDTFSLKHITVTADSNILIGTQINDGHKFYLKGQPRIDIGGDATGDTYFRDALGGMARLAKPTGLTKPVLGFDATGMKPKWEEDKWSDTTSLSSRINLKQNISDTNTVDATRYWVQQNEIWKRNGIDVYYPGTGHVGIGTSTPQAGLEIKGAYSLSTQAALQITDTSAGGYLKLGDATTIAGNFTGAIYGKAYGTLADNRNGVSLYGEPGKDTVANAAVSVDGRLDGAPLVNAKLFRVANFLTDKFYVTATGGLWAAGIPISNDTAEVKPLGITSDGTIYRRSNWIGSGGGGTGSATDTTSLSNRINGAYNGITQINDSTFTLNRPNGIKDTVVISTGLSSGGSGDYAPLSHTHEAADITSGTKTSAFISDFTTAARGSISLTTTGTSGAATYTDGVLNIPQYAVTFDYVNVLDYGADATGVSNSASAFASAIATGKNVFVPSGTYLINGTSGTTLLTLQDGQTIFGSGGKSILKTTSAARILAVGALSVVRDLRFVGSATKTTNVTSQNGIYASNKVKWLVERCEFLNIGTAIQVSQLNASYSEGARITNCLFDANYYGIVLSARGEYVVLSNLKIHNNNTGILNAAGNISIIGCDILANTVGLKMITGANNGHSVVGSTMMNHNTTNLDISDVTVGHTFSGVMIYGGHINIASSTGIKFVGCELGGPGTITLTNNTKLLISSSRFAKAPTAGAMTVTVVSGENFIEANNLDY